MSCAWHLGQKVTVGKPLPRRESPLLSCPPRQRPPGWGGMPFFQESWQEPFCATAPAPHPAADPPQLTPEAICLDFANNNQSRAPNGSGRQLRLNNRALCPADIVQCRGRIKAWDALGTPSTELASKPRTSPPPGVFMVQRDFSLWSLACKRSPAFTLHS